MCDRSQEKPAWQGKRGRVDGEVGTESGFAQEDSKFWMLWKCAQRKYMCLIAEYSVQKAFIPIVLGYPVVTGPSLLTSNSNMGSVAGELPSVHRVSHPRMPESMESRDLVAQVLTRGLSPTNWETLGSKLSLVELSFMRHNPGLFMLQGCC